MKNLENNASDTRVFLVAFGIMLVLLCTTLALGFGLASINDDNVAEAYDSISGQVVNFNQLCNVHYNTITQWSSSSTGTFSQYGNGVTLSGYTGRTGIKYVSRPVHTVSSGHKVFIICDYFSTVQYSFYPFIEHGTSSTYGAITLPISSTSVNYSRFFTFDVDVDLYLDMFPSVTNQVGDLTIYNFMIFDLTQIYGSGNEPTTLAQFKQDFPSDYYAFTLSSTINTGYNNGYSDGHKTGYNLGFNDGLYDYDSAYKVPWEHDYTYNPNNVNLEPLASYRAHSAGYGITGNNSQPFIIGSQLPSIIYSGQSVTMYFYYFDSLFEALDGYFSIGSFIDGRFNVFVEITSLNDMVYFSNFDESDLGTYRYRSVSFSLNTNIDNIAFKFGTYVNFTDLEDGLSIDDVEIYTSKPFDYNSRYSTGYEDGKNSVNVRAIEEVAYNRGHADGLVDANDYTFLGLMGSIVDAPIVALFGTYDSATNSRVGGLFNLTILGTDMTAFVTALLSLALIVIVIKFALAK